MTDTVRETIPGVHAPICICGGFMQAYDVIEFVRGQDMAGIYVRAWCETCGRNMLIQRDAPRHAATMQGWSG